MRQPKDIEPEQVFGSTSFEWRRVKMSRPPEASKPRRAQRGRWYHLPPTDWRRPITVTIKYRGGAEAWIEVRSRGAVGRYPGYVQIVDVLAEITRHR